jgi:hypothetical protein
MSDFTAHPRAKASFGADPAPAPDDDNDPPVAPDPGANGPVRAPRKGRVSPPRADRTDPSGSDGGAATPTPPPALDIPGCEDLPADVRERLRKARRDPTTAAALKVNRQSRAIRVESPSPDDLFRVHPDPETGCLDVHVVWVKKTGNRRMYLVGDKALTNPAVAERARPGVALLTVTAEGVVGVWVIAVPDMAAAEGSYPFDSAKWDCAWAARDSWVTFAWDKEQGIHRWNAVDLDGQPNERPAWPAEHPLVLIDRAIASVFVDDPDFPEFKGLVTRRAPS